MAMDDETLDDFMDTIFSMAIMKGVSHSLLMLVTLMKGSGRG